MKKNIKKFIFNYGMEIMVLILSLVTLIIGSFIIKFIPSLILVVVLDLIWFSPDIIKKFKKVKINDYRDKEEIHYQNEVKEDSVKKVNKKSNKKEKNNTKENKVKKKNSKKEINDTKKKKSSKLKKIFKALIIIFLLLFIVGCIAGFGFMYYIAKNAPEFKAENLYHQESTIVYDRDGNEIAKLGSEKREIIGYDDLSEELINAIVATEDSKFFEHNGFDASRFLVASFKQVTGGGGGGASTLTMQVVKNHYTSTNASGIEGIIRKFTDIYMSIFMVEEKYSKKEIMEFYINSNYLGDGAYGVEQAAHNYFNKSAKDLNVAEAAMIAGLFQAPGSLDPYKYPENAEKRRKTVLRLMERHGYLTTEEKEAAEKLTIDKLLKPEHKNDTIEYQSYIDVVAQEVEKMTGHDMYMTSMKVYTNMDPKLQTNMNDIMSGKAFNFENSVINAGVTIIDNNTGEIRAVGGGRHNEGAKSFSTAVDTKRQIGSTAKPLYDYAPGIEYENWSTYTPWIDEPYTYTNGPSITNWDGGYKGFITSRDALVDSRNVPALKAFQSNKNSNIKNFVTSVGLSPEETLHEAHAIGGYNGESPTSLAGAYSVFSNGGYYTEPHSVSKIEYRNSDKVVKNEKVKTKVLSDSTAYMITDMLVDAVDHNMGRYKYINGAHYTAKTGTTNFSTETKNANGLSSDAINDLWCVGYNPQYTVAVWYGYDKIDKAHYSRFGNREHTRLFQTVGKYAFTNTSDFVRPSSVVDVAVEYGTNPAKLPSSSTPSDRIITELFKAGTEPTEVSAAYIKLANVNNIKGTIEDTKISISWDPVAGLGQISTTGFGKLGYDIYRKDGDNLTFIKFTTSTSFSEAIESSKEQVSYVIKSTYETNKDYASGGATINLVKAEDVKIALKGNNPYQLESGQSYVDPGVTITSNGKVVDKSNYQVAVSLNDEQSFDDIKDTPGTYTLTYTITYKNKAYKLTRSIIVK